VTADDWALFAPHPKRGPIHATPVGTPATPVKRPVGLPVGPDLDRSWIEDAACKDYPDKEVFFPSRGDTLNLAKARTICMGCPVRVECLEYALASETGNRTASGVWGGLSGKQRRKIAEQRRRNRLAS
jgi:WhiB family redox-sensing transcriptional regulator